MEGVQPTKPGSLDDPASKADDNKRINEELDNLNGGGTSPRKRSKSSNAGSGAGGGVAPIQAQYLVHSRGSTDGSSIPPVRDDDDAEASVCVQPERTATVTGKSRARGQNTKRTFGSPKDAIKLCPSRALYPEFSPGECRFGDQCKFEHDLRRYLKDGKGPDLSTFGGRCPVWDARGVCTAGWKCRFLASHMEERENDDGRKELALTVDTTRGAHVVQTDDEEDAEIINIIGIQKKMDLARRKVRTEKTDAYIKWLDANVARLANQSQGHAAKTAQNEIKDTSGQAEVGAASNTEEREEQRARYTEAPLLPSEKRRIYFGPETPVLAPLTTQGNLPFRRLCVDLGAQITYSEMAMSLPLIQGAKSEWALLKAHLSEVAPPLVAPVGSSVDESYQNSTDLKFGAQISANKPWQAVKATEIITTFCPHVRVVDLNCGCPIDLVYRSGAGSGLLDNQAKLEKMIQGMGAVSGEVPITVKIRMGTKDGKPTALKLARRLVLGGLDVDVSQARPSGVAAITLHGRSRQQRYTRSADWEYISQCAALIKRLTEEQEMLTDTVREGDARAKPATSNGRVFFVGNGDCYSHAEYRAHIEAAGVDSVMLGRGALIKPWIFEEIQQNQYLDKSASERLAYVERFAKYGLEAWGSDEIGVGTTRRFLLEWLSFAYRYVPLGILEHLPPRIQDRPPRWQGRNDLETLLGSDNCQDWMKISEMFLGPAHKDFHYEPKHRSNAYELEAEG